MGEEASTDGERKGPGGGGHGRPIGRGRSVGFTQGRADDNRIRLARFNVYQGVTDRRYFVGLPTPAAAGIVASTALLLEGVVVSRWQAAAMSVGTVIVALLMVSTFRYYSFKEVDFARRRPAQVLVLVVLGGRLGYVLLYEPATYLASPLDVLAVWQGGMSFHGALIGCAIAIWL
ncbi:hypothetical protein B4Q13_15235, partial [Lacticaseibacillus rhamnosus]